MAVPKCHIGCAGWSLPRELRDPAFSYLERYAQLFDCVEINSSFYRHHQPKTYARWANLVPEKFRFSVKVPKMITHLAKDIEITAAKFLSEVSELGSKLGPLLLQFPPKAQFTVDAATQIFHAFRERFDGDLVCEPRHPSWFDESAVAFMKRHAVSLVAAHPPAVPNAPDIFGSAELHYYRLHGAPRIYYSEYSRDFLRRLRQVKTLHDPLTWVIFDNTTLGQAQPNALALKGHAEFSGHEVAS